jgi:membrane protein
VTTFVDAYVHINDESGEKVQRLYSCRHCVLASYVWEDKQPVAKMRLSEVREEVIEVMDYLADISLGTRAAAVSYYSMLASIPLLAVFVTIAARLLPDIYGPAAAVGIGDLTVHELNAALARVLPSEATRVVTHEIARLQSEPPVGILSIGIFLSLWTSSNAFKAIVGAINKIYGIEETRPFWTVRLVAVLMPLLLSGVMIVTLASIVALPTVISMLKLNYYSSIALWSAQWVGLFVTVLLSFGLTYHIAPAPKARQPLFSAGSFAGAGLFLLFSMAFQYYVNYYAGYDKVYGSLGGAIVFLIWLWLVSACLLLGCAINKSLENHRTHGNWQGINLSSLNR